MKKIVLVLLWPAFLMTTMHAQEKLELKGSIDQIQATLDSLRTVEVQKAVKDTAFVIEAELVSIEGRHPVPVSPRNNFFLADGGDCTFQTSFDIPGAGLNGLGGVTLDGKIGRYDPVTDENGNIRLEIMVNGMGASGNIYILIPSSGETVRLSYTPTFRPVHVTMSGRLVSKSRSNVFKGSELF